MTRQPEPLPDLVPAERESLFQKIADYVSEAMGRPANIIFWLVIVLAWTFVFAFGGPHLASGTWLPSWFTSQGYNFPLNLITTVAELFIGFLVAAATNRAERALMAIIDGIQTAVRHCVQVIDRVSDVEDNLATAIRELHDLGVAHQEAMQANTELTQQVHDLTVQVHQLVSGS